MKILMCGPSNKCKGGIASVINGLLLHNQRQIEYIFVPIRGDGSALKKSLQYIVGMIKSVFVLLKQDIKLIHAHPSEYIGFYRYLPFILLSKVFRAPIIFHMHGGSFKVFFNTSSTIGKHIILTALVKVDCMVCLTNSWVDYYKSLGLQRVYMLNNAVPQPAENPYNVCSTDIIFIGFIEQKKGVYDLIKALALVLEHKDTVLHIAGSGDSQKLLDLALEIGVSKSVVLHGWVSVAERNKLLEEMAIFVLPSYFEAQPMSLIEAMAYGVPSICSNVGGLPEMIENMKNGVLINPGDVKGLADSIIALLDNHDLRKEMSVSAFQKVKENYSMTTSFTRLTEIYSQVLQQS